MPLLLLLLLLAGCTTIPLGDPGTQYGVSRDRMLHVMPMPMGRKLILLRDRGLYWCWGTPKKTSCLPRYKGEAVATKKRIGLNAEEEAQWAAEASAKADAKADAAPTRE